MQSHSFVVRMVVWNGCCPHRHTHTTLIPPPRGKNTQCTGGTERKINYRYAVSTGFSNVPHLSMWDFSETKRSSYSHLKALFPVTNDRKWTQAISCSPTPTRYHPLETCTGRLWLKSSKIIDANGLENCAVT